MTTWLTCDVSGIFISYRQDDSKPWALMLRDALAQAFGDDRVFLDKDALQAGNWRNQLHAALERARVVLVVIGQRWLTGADTAGQRRLWDPEDVHRQEIAIALSRPEITVIPVRVDQAPLPRAEELPPDIRTLLDQQSREISDSKRRREVDLQLLIEDIERITGMPARRKREWFGATLSLRARLIATAVVVGVLGSTAWLGWRALGGNRGSAAIDIGLRPTDSSADSSTTGATAPAPENTPADTTSTASAAVLPVSLPTSVETRANWGERQMAEDDIEPERHVAYSARLASGVSRITFELPYLARLANGGPIEGINYLGTPFKWRFPELSVRAVNNTSGTMVLSEARLEVISSHPITTPVITVEDLSVDKLVFHNEGWGEVVDPSITLTIGDADAGGTVSLFAPASHTISLPSFSDGASIPLASYLPERLRQVTLVMATGRIEYGEANRRHSISFKTRVSLQVRSAVGIPPSHFYDIGLKAGESGIVRQVPLAQEIAAGGADHFVIRLGADKSSTQQLRITFRTADGRIFDGGELAVDIFVPRSAGKILQASQRP